MLAVDCRGAIAEVFTNQAYVPLRHFLTTADAHGGPGGMVKITQIAQRASDLDRARAFYGDLLRQDAAAVFDPPGLVFFMLDGVRLLLEREAPSALIYLQVPDVRSETARLKDAGVEVVAEPRLIFHHDDATLGPAGNDEWMAFVRDSERNTIGLVSYSIS
jgi:methylmalonyl-CoA/ethylmalonyl-CoA epimerase